jgi:hypothetical protein
MTEIVGDFFFFFFFVLEIWVMVVQIFKAIFRIVELLEGILAELSAISRYQSSQSFQDDEKLMTRQEVQDYLKISETTYKKHVRNGLLKPMKMPGGHRFLKRDLDAAYLESVRRGRV